MEKPSAEDQQNVPSANSAEFLKSIKIPTPDTIRKIDMALSNSVEGIFYLLGGDRIHLYNARKRNSIKKSIECLSNEFEKLDGKEIATEPVPLQIQEPIIEQMAITEDENLRSILVNLLISASTKEGNTNAHPSMLTIAKSISPDEALILSSLGNSRSIPMIDVKFFDKRPEMKNATIVARRYFSQLDYMEGLLHTNNMDLYIGNLISFGLYERNIGFVPVEKDGGNTPHSDYLFLEQEAKKKYIFPNENFAMKNERFYFSSTPKGDMFINAINIANRTK